MSLPDQSLLEPYWQLNGSKLYQGHILDVLPVLQAQSVHCIATSPPYWGLRDYGLPSIEWSAVRYAPMAGLPEIEIPGCVEGCDHVWVTETRKRGNGGEREYGSYDGAVGRGPAVKLPASQYCQCCCGWRGSYGLEPTVEMYVGHTVAICRELRRVLRDDGCMFWNLGDSYVSNAGAQNRSWADKKHGLTSNSKVENLKPKDLVGIPWRVALALQADGWWLRNEVPWLKRNCMPESVRDRFTTSHETWFLFAKSKRYFFDPGAVRGYVGLDAVRELVYNQQYGNKTMHDLQTDTSSLSVLSTEERAEPGRNLQNLREKPSDRMEADTKGQGVSTADLGKVQCQQTRETEKEKVQSVRGAEGISATVRKVPQRQSGHSQIQENQGEKGCIETVRGNGEVQGDTAQVSSVSQGQSVISERCTQAPDGDSERNQRLDCRAMAGDSRAVQSQLRLLRDIERVNDDGSRCPALERGGAHHGKYSASVPQLQQQEKRQSSGRNRRTFDGWYESLEILIEQYRRYLGYLEHIRDSGGFLLSEDGEPLSMFYSTKPYKKAHFATFSGEMIAPLILCSTSAKGCCPECGAGWVRVTDVAYENPGNRTTNGPRSVERRHETAGFEVRLERRSTTTGWRPTCTCDAGEPVPCTVLDPFTGSGTTPAVARQLGRRWVGIELSKKYCDDHIIPRLTEPLFEWAEEQEQEEPEPKPEQLELL